MNPAVSHAIAEFSDVRQRLQDVMVLRAADNSMVRLGDIMQRGPVLICFFRRWGCALCKMSAVNLSVIKPYLDEKGVQLVGIGVERLGYEQFVADGYFAGELFIDEAKAGYAALNLQKNSWRNLWGLGPAIIKIFASVRSKGYKNDMSGDRQQLGGTFLIDGAGQCLFAHKQTTQSFEPNVAQILEALGVDIPASQLSLYPSLEEFQRKESETK